MLSLASRVLTQGEEAGAAAACSELNSVVVVLCVGQHHDMSFVQLVDDLPGIFGVRYMKSMPVLAAMQSGGG